MAGKEAQAYVKMLQVQLERRETHVDSELERYLTGPGAGISGADCCSVSQLVSTSSSGDGIGVSSCM